MNSPALQGPPWEVAAAIVRTQYGDRSPYIPPAGPLTLKEVYEFDLNGFTVLRSFLAPDLVARFNRVIDAGVSRPADPAAFCKFPFLHLDPAFLDLMSDDRVVSICRHWLGPWFRLDHTFGIQAGPFAVPCGPQQEDLHAGPYAEEGVFRYSWFNNRSHSGLMVFVYCLEPVRSGDGGLVLVPGSHKSNLALTGQDVFADILHRSHSEWWVHNPQLDPGDLLIFTEATVHGTMKWKPAGRRRRNLHYSYGPGYQAQVDHGGLGEQTALARNDRERDLLRGPFVIQRDNDSKTIGENHWRNTVR